MHRRHQEAIIQANGDQTIRTNVVDIPRQIPWPCVFTARVKRNAFTQRWHGREDLLEQNVALEAVCYRQAVAEGDPDYAGVWFGEAAGIINAIEPAAAIVERMAVDAAELLVHQAGFCKICEHRS